jgi:hypothetical protein
MGVVSACALSFMSKYLHQSCGPKPMIRVDINDNNQSSNNIPLCHLWQHSFSPYHHDLNLSPPLISMAKGRASPPEFNGKRYLSSLGLLPLNMWHSIILHPYFWYLGLFLLWNPFVWLFSYLSYSCLGCICCSVFLLQLQPIFMSYFL